MRHSNLNKAHSEKKHLNPRAEAEAPRERNLHHQPTGKCRELNNNRQRIKERLKKSR